MVGRGWHGLPTGTRPARCAAGDFWFRDPPRGLIGILWNIPAGTSEVWRGGATHLTISRPWLDAEHDLSERLATLPRRSAVPLGEIEIRSGWLVIIWAAEDGREVLQVDPGDGVSLSLFVGHDGLIAELPLGRYVLTQDEVEVAAGSSRRCFVDPSVPAHWSALCWTTFWGPGSHRSPNRSVSSRQMPRSSPRRWPKGRANSTWPRASIASTAPWRMAWRPSPRWVTSHQTSTSSSTRDRAGRRSSTMLCIRHRMRSVASPTDSDAPRCSFLTSQTCIVAPGDGTGSRSLRCSATRVRTPPPDPCDRSTLRMTAGAGS